ncbi:divalent metal cation transporter [Trinickia violacea]|uniref:Divalent metal cation transporter n=1 Tax=Trinickia violacea TaxID=2571746 RepID=A0A4P8J2I9_9BURK|nr:divalent metal cation transporter [Trinickia violacea]QCP54313.1 divalent metal cation transporter [Trinickia violacea]
MSQVPQAATLWTPFRWIAVWGPGLLVMLADADAGNVVTAAQAGAQWGYRLLPLLLVLIVPLYLIQELTVRLGIYTRRGHGELVREHFGRGWAWLSAAGLGVAAAGSLVTEFTAVAGIGDMAGLPRSLTLSAAALALLAVVATGSYRRIERTALVIGLFELAFFVVAWTTHPDWRTVAFDAVNLPFSNRAFLYLAAALIGAVFNPWMVFYQQAAVASKRLSPEDCKAARVDTAAGAVLTQWLTAAVLIAAAATLGSKGAQGSLASVGDISQALAPVLGTAVARIVFGAGVLGAAMVAAIVASLALAWGVGEVAGYRHSLELRPQQAPWFYGVYGLVVAGSAALVWAVRDLVWLNIGAQVVNALLLPLVLGLLIALASRALPDEARLKGAYKWVLAAATCAVCALGWVGAIAGWIRGA